jgi:ABC-type Fe3+ transport system substrate-binding protein
MPFQRLYLCAIAASLLLGAFGCRRAQPGAAKKLIDYLVSQKAEQKLLDLKFARWSVRAGTGGENGIKAMRIDYRAAARVYPVAQRVSGALLEGRQPE